MTHTYKITGMTCAGCQARVRDLLSKVHGVQAVDIDLNRAEARISMDHHISTEDLASALADHPKYQLFSEAPEKAAMHQFPVEEDAKAGLKIYKPIFLIFGYLLGLTLVTGFVAGTFFWQRWMAHFMAGFFLVFSFFKMLDLKGFAESYAMYDVVAKKWKEWGYLYAFMELALGIAFLTGFQPLFTNVFTFILMSVSITGVLQSVLNKRKIPCACLGAIFNLPMSTVTILEDMLMIVMSAIMLISMI
ncbi:MAG: cation transporter [Bacteroidota bacterium]|nr:cation transporter [Bacteroidota bacterium]MDP4212725.1 cation transporter [Bacteroidota bacterium]MDP4250531.1 cation transporter [Bacteroidota bacterium]